MNAPQVITQKNQLMDLWWAGVTAVNGQQTCVEFAEKLPRNQPLKVAAVGKAAPEMMRGLLSAGVKVAEGLVISKSGFGDADPKDFPRCQLMTASHPLPDESSVAAGTALCEFVTGCSEEDHFVLLLSGGASSLAVKPLTGMSLSTILTKVNMLIKSGATIEEINHYRRTVSQIKGGKLHEQFTGRHWTTALLSDVEGDEVYTVGSGLGACNPNQLVVEYTAHLLGTNKKAREAIALSAEQRGILVLENTESLYDDVHRLANVIANKIRSASGPGILIMGGEPTIRLPEKPGKGGRNQSLALALAIAISGEKNVAIMVAGTDGDDGTSSAAGAVIDGNTVGNLNHAHRALKAADAATYLKKQGAQFVSGPTGTNVMDIVIAYKW